MIKPSVFVGSSTEGLDVARSVAQQLQDVAEITLWNEGVFALSLSMIESLLNAVERFDFAVLVVAPDDLVVSRNAESFSPRDNVVFELGLFMGRLGRARTFIVCDPRRVRLPSDLAGVTVAAFDSARADGNQLAAVGPATHAIRLVVRDLGLSERNGAHQLQQATESVEIVSASVEHLTQLLARSRVTELDVFLRSYGSMLTPELRDQLARDRHDLQQSTTTANTGQSR